MIPSLKSLEKLLIEGRISRREFLARVSALGLTAAVSTALWNPTASASAPKKGGRLRLGMAGGHTTNSLDPALLEEAVACTISMGMINNYLVEVDHQGQAIPELAESWESTPDASQWIFKLRKGVEFHNGKTMDAQDVLFSINHHRKEGTKSPGKAIVESINDIKADGKHSVIITLEAGNADFPFLMSDYHLPIIPAGTTDFEKGIGTGGYKLVKWEPGVRVFAKRNPNYWKAGRAHFDEVEITGISDVTARISALKTGRVDAINRCDPKIVKMLKKTPGIQVMSTTGAQHYTFPMLTDVSPHDNNDVRLALKYAIDREKMVDLILRGHGSVGNDHPIAPFQRFFASELPQRKYDPEKAKFHLKKAGIDEHIFKLHAANTAFEGAIDTAVLYKESAAKAGIKIQVVREPNDGYWDSVWLKKPWVSCYWLGRPTEDWMFSLVYAANGKWNDAHWKHKRFNSLLKMARSELDLAKRREMYVEMQTIVRNEGGTVIPAFANIVEAASTKVKFENIAGNAEIDGFKGTERWWFES